MIIKKKMKKENVGFLAGFGKFFFGCGFRRRGFCHVSFLSWIHKSHKLLI